jgi:hypothetical protein
MLLPSGTDTCSFGTTLVVSQPDKQVAQSGWSSAVSSFKPCLKSEASFILILILIMILFGVHDLVFPYFRGRE